MNFLIQHGKVRGQMISVPEGLPELLSDITREVLRCQPSTECLCQFIIDYLYSVIQTREKARVAKSIIDRSLRMVDEVIGDMCICDLSKEKVDKMAVVMEQCFRNYIESRRCDHREGRELVKFNEIDILEQLIQKCKFSDFEIKVSRPLIEDAYNKFVSAYMLAAEGSEGTEFLYEYFRDRELKRLQLLEEERAAIVIQANFRGYRSRKSHVFRSTKDSSPISHIQYTEKHDAAARKIQKFYRNSRLSEGLNPSVPPLLHDPPSEVCSPKSGRSIVFESEEAPMEETLQPNMEIELVEEEPPVVDIIETVQEEPPEKEDVPVEVVVEPTVEESPPPPPPASEPEPEVPPATEAEAEVEAEAAAEAEAVPEELNETVENAEPE